MSVYNGHKVGVRNGRKRNEMRVVEECQTIDRPSSLNSERKLEMDGERSRERRKFE